jgi:hypothetical protein
LIKEKSIAIRAAIMDGTSTIVEQDQLSLLKKLLEKNDRE